MQYGIHLPNFGAFADPRVTAQIAQEAESAGWDGVFIWDHLTRQHRVPVADPWISLSAIATATERVRIGTLVTPLARRRPQKIAKECVTLDWLSGGRFILGVGTGGFGGAEVEWENFGEVMDHKTRAAMTDEALAIITGLWTGKPFSFEGIHYQVKESLFEPTPLQQPRIPIWIAGYYPNRLPMKRAARWDGMFMLFDNTDEWVALQETTQYIHNLRESDAPFDMIYIDRRPEIASLSDRQSLAQQAQSSGATWWLEEITPHRYGGSWEGDWHLEKMRDHIQQGAPR